MISRKAALLSAHVPALRTNFRPELALPQPFSPAWRFCSEAVDGLGLSLLGWPLAFEDSRLTLSEETLRLCPAAVEVATRLLLLPSLAE